MNRDQKKKRQNIFDSINTDYNNPKNVNSISSDYDSDLDNERPTIFNSINSNYNTGNTNNLSKVLDSIRSKNIEQPTIFDSIYNYSSKKYSNTITNIGLFSQEGNIIKKKLGYHRLPKRIQKNNSSKIDSSNLNSLIFYYHGTTFAEANNLIRYGLTSLISEDSNTFGRGFYISKSINKASIYGNFIIIVKLQGSLTLASYFPNHQNHSLPNPPRVNDKGFINQLRQKGYDGIEVNKGVYIPNWRRKNHKVKEHEMCIWNTAKLNLLYILEF